MSSKRCSIWLSGLLAAALVLTGHGYARAQTEGDASDSARPGVGAQGVDVARQSALAVGEAASDVGAAVKTGGQGTVAQGRRLWQEVFLPAAQRSVAAVPALLKALLLLVAFWVAGMLVGGGVRRLLDLTRIDDRAVRDWGLEELLRRPDGQTRSLAAVLGNVIKWVLVLFGFVAFFNALNLSMVATPLQRVLDSIFGVVPNLLKAAAILFVYWAIAAIARFAVVRGLQLAKFDERTKRFCAKPDAAVATEEAKPENRPSARLGRLTFYVVLLFGVMPFLDALGQQALVAPLQEMFGKFLDFVPNLVAAGIIVLVGRIVSTIVREVVANFLAASGLDRGAERLGISQFLGGKALSEVVSRIAYFFILIPIIIAAVDSLGLKLLSDPIKSTLEKVLAAVPALLVATLIVVVGLVVAKVVRSLVETLLSGVGFDGLPGRLGLGFLSPKAGQMPLSRVVGAFVMVSIILITAQQAAASLHFDQLANLLRLVVEYLPDLVVGLLILLAALSVSSFVAGLVERALSGQPHAKVLAIVARVAIILLGAGMALEHLGVASAIVTVALAAILSGAALALGLAFGLGGKERAKDALDRWTTGSDGK